MQGLIFQSVFATSSVLPLQPICALYLMPDVRLSTTFFCCWLIQPECILPELSVGEAKIIFKSSGEHQRCMFKYKFMPRFWAEIKLVMEVFIPSQILLRYLVVFSGHLLGLLLFANIIYLEKQEGS